MENGGKRMGKQRCLWGGFPKNRKERYMKRPGKEKNPEMHEHAEDIVFKTAGEYFGKEALSFFKIPQKMKRIMPTEKIRLEARRMYEDFNIEMESGEIYHFEFESDPLSKRDLRRFRQYEAVMGYVYQRDVVTYVVCTAAAKVQLTRLRTGINTYRLKVVRINQRSADRLYERLGKTAPEERKKEELLAAVFSPLMRGRMSIKERVRKGFFYLDQESGSVSEEERKKMQAMLYMLATKFLTKEELREVKEEIGMTILGQMLMDDGMQKGALEARAADIMDILEELGTVTSELSGRIRDEKNENTLKKWVKLAAKAKSVEQFAAEM